MDAPSFAAWGWRIPFFISIILVLISIYVRTRLNESPAFALMKSEGRLSKAPIKESFGNAANLRLVLLALFGVNVGEGVVWNCGNFYVLFFITSTLKVDYRDVPTSLS
jgi:MFS family permease